MVLIENFAVSILNGLMWGAIIGLMALGLNLIYGLLEIVNLTHGSLFMLGAFLAWATIGATGSFLLALVVAAAAMCLLGVGIERVVLRPVEDDIPITLVVTFGLILVLQQVARLTFGPVVRVVGTPIPGSIRFAGITYPTYRIVVAVLSVMLIVATYLFLEHTRVGMWMRGVRQDREMAASLGVPTKKVYMLTFGIGSAFAAIAGVLLAPIINVHNLMGLDIIGIAFIVIIVGGLGSLRGMLLASLVYALVENIGSIFIGTLEARIFVLAVMIAFVLAYPDGLENALKEVGV